MNLKPSSVRYVHIPASRGMPLHCQSGRELCWFVGLPVSRCGSGLAVPKPVDWNRWGTIKKYSCPGPTPELKSESVGDKTRSWNVRGHSNTRLFGGPLGGPFCTRLVRFSSPGKRREVEPGSGNCRILLPIS